MMYFIALATDYDGTLAHDGIADQTTVDALRRFKETGRKLILVTGRELPDLKRVFPDLALFDRVVAENGALLYTPASEQERLIAPEPNAEFIERLQAKGVTPLSVGRSIVATWHPNETIVLEAIHDLGLELQIIFNKGAVMILPPSVNKASGLEAALDDLSLSPLNVIGFGDAENDYAFLSVCGCAVAVANALPRLKETADIVTQKDHGAGVTEVIEALLADEAAILRRIERHRVVFGQDEQGREAALSQVNGSVLIAGASGGGKSSLATTLLECLDEKGFQICVVDPEGDYDEFKDAVILGDAKAVPRTTEILDVLRKPDSSVVVNLLGLERNERPIFFMKLLPELLHQRAETARPHWILIDEAHHMLPAARGAAPASLPRDLPAAIMVTIYPDELSAEALTLVETILTVGDEARDMITRFCGALGKPCPSLPSAKLNLGQALLWNPRSDQPARIVSVRASHMAHRRHTRKYAEGDLGEEESFYFRGPNGALNLRAQNLMIFLQIAEGVDDATWLHHLRAGDYSKWIRQAVKDGQLADEVAAVEKDETLALAQTKARVREAVNRRYTAPAQAEPKL